MRFWQFVNGGVLHERKRDSSRFTVQGRRPAAGTCPFQARGSGMETQILCRGRGAEMGSGLPFAEGTESHTQNVAIILRRKWRFPGTKADPNSKVNLDAAGRRLISVQSIADDLDISDTTVRSAIDLLESTGLLFDVVKHGHPKNKYDRVFFRWNEELYRHPDRIDVSQLPKKAGGDQFPPCPGCKTQMETRNVRYARSTKPE